jgi:hypothetical protein
LTQKYNSYFEKSSDFLSSHKLHEIIPVLYAEKENNKPAGAPAIEKIEENSF